MANYLGSGGFDPSSYMIQKLMDQLFKDKTPEYKAEASTMASLVNSANTQEAFENLTPILQDWAKRNDTMGEEIQGIEAVLMPAFQSKKEQFGKLKQATVSANKLLDPTYYVSEADKARSLAGGTDLGGIQNINKEDISGWTYERMAKESDAINTILDGFTGGKGMTFNIKDGKYTTEQIKRSIAEYKATLDAGLQMAYYSGSIPDDPRLIRAVMEGKSDIVEKIRTEETANQKKLYNDYNTKIGTLYETKNKVDAKIGTETNTVLQNQQLFTLLSGKSGDKEWDEHMQKYPDLMAEAVSGMDAASLNYEQWSENIVKQIGGADGTGGLIGARDTANERYKKYEGIYIEDKEVVMGKEMSMMFGDTTPSQYTVPVTPTPLVETTPSPLAPAPIAPLSVVSKDEKAIPFSYDDIIGIPKVGGNVDDIDYFNSLEELIQETKLGTIRDGKEIGKGYKILNRIKQAYQKSLDYNLKKYRREETRDNEEFWNKKSKQALASFLRSKHGTKLIKALEDLIEKKLPEDRKLYHATPNY